MEDLNLVVGQQVYDQVNCPDTPGKVVAIRESQSFCVKVQFGEFERSYTSGGAYLKDGSQVLFPYPYQFEIKRIWPKFKRGQLVLVRDKEDGIWLAKRFIESREIQFPYVCGESTSSMGSAWKYCIAFEGNERLLLTTDAP